MEGTDLIEVRGLKISGRHGVTQQEQSEDQPFIVSLAARIDTREAAAFDDLGATLDYAEVVRLVKATMTGQPYHLLETLADRIARQLLANKRVLDVWVRVAKTQAPLDADVEEVAVEVSRSREDVDNAELP